MRRGCQSRLAALPWRCASQPAPRRSRRPRSPSRRRARRHRPAPTGSRPSSIRVPSASKASRATAPRSLSSFASVATVASSGGRPPIGPGTTRSGSRVASTPSRPCLDSSDRVSHREPSASCRADARGSTSRSTCASSRGSRSARLGSNAEPDPGSRCMQAAGSRPEEHPPPLRWQPCFSGSVRAPETHPSAIVNGKPRSPAHRSEGSPQATGRSRSPSPANSNRYRALPPRPRQIPLPQRRVKERGTQVTGCQPPADLACYHRSRGATNVLAS